MNLTRLDAKTRARLFSQLAQAGHAGLPWARCIPVLRKSGGKSLRPVLDDFERRLNKGADIADSGLRAGLFLPWEARLIGAAEKSGKLDNSFRSLSGRYKSRANRQSRIRGGLMFPLVLFILATLVAPLGPLLTEAISIGQYLIGVCSRLLLLFGGLVLLTWSWKRLGVHGADSSIFAMILRIPWFGTLVRRQQQRDFLDSLAMALGAGIPAFDALELAAESVSNPHLRSRFGRSAKYAQDGSTITESILRVKALQNSDAENLLRSGELSGRSEEMLNHLVAGLDEQLDSQYQIISDWTPRIAYVVVIILFLSSW
ncbi:MAG TPA: type II secretion system F family protein [Xanthomonadales bacterium]|nr:type II secretion system F family protein [Xanthomonadales bacterium]